jgi:aspartate/methionine/tyrosine aminotransferase
LKSQPTNHCSHWPEYFGAHIKRFPRSFANDFRVDVDELAKQLSPRTRLIVLTNLHNPSSTLIAEDTLRRIGELAREAGARGAGRRGLS